MNKKTLAFFFGLVTSNAFADSLVGDGPVRFYFGVGVSIIKPAKLDGDLKEQTMRSIINPPGLFVLKDEFHYKVKNIAVPSVSLGYYLHPRFSLEALFAKPLVQNLYSSSNFKASGPYVAQFDGEAIPIPKGQEINSSARYSANIDIVQLRAHINAFDFKDYGALYVAAGYGISKISLSSSMFVHLNGSRIYNIKNTKVKYAPNWMLGAGVNINLAEGVKLGLGYELQNWGKIKGYSNEENPDLIKFERSKKIFKGQGAAIKLIYDI